MDKLRRLLVVLAVGTALASATVAHSFAETATTDSDKQEHRTIPERGDAADAGSLSQQLNESHGVIKPPADIDSGATVSPPPEGRTPIIPPPGTDANKGNVNPK